MRNMFTALFALVTALTSIGAVAETYYVHPDGNDDKSGLSHEEAWKSIARANKQQFNSGDRLLFAAGQKFSGNLVVSGRAANGAQTIVIGSYGSENQGRAIIEAGLGTAVLIRDVGGVEVQDLVCIGEDRTRNAGCGVAFVNTLPKNASLKHVRIQRVEASGFGRELAPPKSETKVNEGYQLPQGAGIFVGGAASDRSKSGFDDVEIEGCWVHGNAYYGILITGYWDDHATRYAITNLHIEDCRAYENSGDPKYHENHSGSGILVEDTDDGIVERCIAYENGAQCDKAPGGPCGIWTASSNNVIIQCCESHHNHTGTAPDGDGFDIDGGCTHCVLQYNYSHDNDGAGYLLYTYAGAPRTDQYNTIRFNVSENDALKLHNYGGIYTGNDGHGMSGAEIYNNTIIAPKSVPAALNIHGNNIGAAFRNNLILASAGNSVVNIDRDSEKLVFQGNLYWSNDGVFKISGEKSYDSLDAWRKTGKEMLNGTAVGIVADPKLNLAAPRPAATGDTKTFSTIPAFLPPPDSPEAVGLDLQKLFKIDPGVREFTSRKFARLPIGACAPFAR